MEGGGGGLGLVLPLASWPMGACAGATLTLAGGSKQQQQQQLSFVCRSLTTFSDDACAAALVVPQYSLITWRRLAAWRPSGLAGAHGRTFELVHFMTAVIARREEERLQRLQQGMCRSAESKPLLKLQQLQVGEGPSMQHQEQQQQQQDQQPNYPRPKQQREQFSPFPECLPLPSLKQAQQHLHSGRGTKALQLLCPGPPLLLYTYASLAGDLQLLVQLVQDQGNKLHTPYPGHTLVLSCRKDFRFKTAQLCCHGAMRAGDPAVLAWLLKTASQR